MEESELVSSAGSGSYGGEPQTESGDSPSEGSNEETLNLVESAILRTLTNHSGQSKSGGGRTLRGRSHNARDEEQQSAVSVKPSNPDDMELLASVLEQVRELRSKRRQRSRKPKQAEIPKRGRGAKKQLASPSEDLRMTLEVATTAAQAAADAAEAAAMAVARNTEAIEVMVSSVKSGKSKRRKSKSVDEKAIVRSNEMTHWALAFMAITTIAWRFGVVRVAKGVSSKLSDPLAYVSGFIGGNDSESSEENPDENAPEKGTLLDKLPHFDMPEIIPNDSHPMSKETKADELEGEETKPEKETSFLAKSAAAVDVKTKEVEKTAFSFANLLHFKPKKT